MNVQKVLNITRLWLPIAVVTAGLCGLVYATVQQSLRHSANDPQIQMAEDAAYALGSGHRTESVLPPTQIDMSQSLAPFLIVYDDAGNVTASSASLYGRPPSLPQGVLGYTRAHGEDRITWQPAPGVRIAAVITPFAATNGAPSGFVLAGRSLREIEERESQVELITGAALLVILAASLAVVVFGEIVLSGTKRQG